MNSNRLSNWDEFIDPRIDILVKNKFYLEALYISFATIEFLLQSNIKNYEEWIRMCLAKRGVKFDLISEKTLQDKPLGELIKIFSKYCEDSSLVSRLNNFNSFRKQVVHKLMDQNIDKLNAEAKSKLETYHQLVADLSRCGLKISNKKIASLSRKIKRINQKRIS